MVFNSIKRVFVFYFLLANLFITSSDIFDIFNDPTKSVDEKNSITVHVNGNDADFGSIYKMKYRTVLSAYRHVIGDWLEKITSEELNVHRLSIQLSSYELNLLETFSTSSTYEQEEAIQQVQTISDLLKRVVHKEDLSSSDTFAPKWSEWLERFDPNTIIRLCLVLVAIGLISYISIRAHLDGYRWFRTFFIFAFITSVFQNWYALYLDELAKIDTTLMKKIPNHCLSNSKDFFLVVRSAFTRAFQVSNDECLEYQKALRAMPHSKATLFQALSVTIAQLFTTPLGTIGEKLSEFFAGTMLHVPYMAWPMIIIFIGLFLIVILMVLKCEISLPFRLLTIRPSSPRINSEQKNYLELEDKLKISQDTITKLNKEVEELKKAHLALQYNVKSSGRTSRPLSNERISSERARSLSNCSRTGSIMENELRNRQNPSHHINEKSEPKVNLNLFESPKMD